MTPQQVREHIIEKLASFVHDPYGFVLWAFPWGEPGPLENETGPDDWQKAQLQDIGRRLTENPHKPILDATSSGHGIGKSAEVSWLTLWSLMTFPRTRGVVTANTDNQLRTKTWAELAKWHGMMLAPLKSMFKLEATAVHAASAGEERRWRIDATPWSERSTEGFAGLHTTTRTLIIYDEASAILDAVWEVTDGALTDEKAEVIWLAYGNPTRNSGRFKEAVEGKFRHVWTSRKIDSRSVKRTNKDLLESWRQAYGEDSDFFRVRVRGEFPRAGSTQFIPSDLVAAARLREPGYIASDPLIFGVDVARGGEDTSVLCIRRGRDARTFPWWVTRTRDTMEVASHVAEQALLYKPDAIFVDVTGIGAGVADRLRQMNLGIMVVDVYFGGKGGTIPLTSGDTIRTSNMSATMWARIRDWLPLASIPDDEELATDLTVREYGYDADMAIQLERKQDMKKRGVASPDKADALALTFAYPVQPRPIPGYDRAGRHTGGDGRYDIHADLMR